MQGLLSLPVPETYVRIRGTAGAAGILVLAYADTDKSGIIKMAGKATVDLILMSMSFLFRASSRGFLRRRLLGPHLRPVRWYLAPKK